jgi:hypothetical protein
LRGYGWRKCRLQQNGQSDDPRDDAPPRGAV